MPCERFANALKETAAGAAATVELDAHLASCGSCRAELAALRKALGAADEELARVAAATPSPQLRARIRAAVADAPQPAGAAFRWVWASVVAAASVVVLAALWTARAPHEARVAGGTTASPGASSGRSAGAVPEREARPSRAASRPVATDPTGTRDAGRGSGPAEVRRPAEAPGGRAAAEDPVETGAAAPEAARALVPRDDAPGRMRARPGSAEVLVPHGEQEALLRLVALVHRERLTPGVLGTVEGPRADLPQLTGIDIAPLAIVPLDPDESAQGEGDTP